MSINDLNLDTAFKVAWAGFMRLGEPTYTATIKIDLLFKCLLLIRSDIIFSQQDKYAIPRLIRRKIDINYIGSFII